MKKLTILLLSLCCIASLHAQQIDLDSLQKLLHSQKPDTGRVKLLLVAGNSFGYGFKRNDSAFYSLQEALDLSNKINYYKGANTAKLIMSRYFYTNGNFKEALELSFQNLKFAEESKDTNAIFLAIKEFMKTYRKMDDYKQVLVYARKYKDILDASSFAKTRSINMYRFAYNNNTSLAYEGLGNMDSALFYAIANYDLYKNDSWNNIALASVNLAQVYEKIGKDDSAYYLFRKCLSITGKTKRNDIISIAKFGLAKYYHKKGITDSAFFYGKQALNELQIIDEQETILETYHFLAELNRDNHYYDSAYKYLQLYVTLNDSPYNNKKIVQAQSFAYSESMAQQKLEQAKKEAEQHYRVSIKFYILAAIILAFSIIAFLLLRNLRNKRKANTLLSKQKEEVQSTLSELKATQAQLIQSEKMASLGELTAGIAHEIQNPLNFVNNFSEVNKEMLIEMKEEMNKGNISDAKEIANDIIANEEKINHHGKRADAIVKGMSQHSRSSSGQKEPTDINALADEYLRLAYHGLLAKDKSFNATLKTDYDESIGNINIIPQDIGRVMLNLITNAFYATTEKFTAESLKPEHEKYEPFVSINTKKLNNKVEITVKDNGNGIPKNIIDKIFQPFFTTKPTGQGTGLGLSLSYDIVKAHGGSITVDTENSTGTCFLVKLPIS